jgi:hypothetical protein
VFLQNSVAVLKSEPPSGLRSSDDTNQVVGIKVEGIADVEDEECREPSSSPLIMTETSVSCMSLCIQCYAHCTDIHEYMLLSVPVCMKDLDSGDCVVKSCFENVSRILCFVVCCLYNTCPVTCKSVLRLIQSDTKTIWCEGLTTLPPSCTDCLEIWEPQPSGTLRVCPGL